MRSVGLTLLLLASPAAAQPPEAPRSHCGGLLFFGSGGQMRLWANVTYAEGWLTQVKWYGDCPEEDSRFYAFLRSDTEQIVVGFFYGRFFELRYSAYRRGPPWPANVVRVVATVRLADGVTRQLPVGRIR